MKSVPWNAFLPGVLLVAEWRILDIYAVSTVVAVSIVIERTVLPLTAFRFEVRHQPEG
jgi:hypothetical protein